MPDDVLPQIPAVSLQGKGEPPRLAYQVLRFQARTCHRAIPLTNPTDTRSASSQRAVLSLATTSCAGISVTHVHPGHAIVSEHIACETKHVDKVSREHQWIRLVAELAFPRGHGYRRDARHGCELDSRPIARRHAVVSQAPVGRRGNQALRRDAMLFPVAQSVANITEKAAIHAAPPRCSRRRRMVSAISRRMSSASSRRTAWVSSRVVSG